MLAAWKRDPTSVHASWQAYFANLEAGVPVDGGAFEPPSSIQSNASPSSKLMGAAPSDSLGVAHLIRAYQFNGHRAANLDPLGLHTSSSFPHRPAHAKDLDIEWHGFEEKDLDRKLVLKGRSTGGMTGYLEE
ncbi:hypothetical protein TrRE_jg1015, partial [Triparma retinervis]